MLWNPRNVYLAQGLKIADPGKGILHQPEKQAYTNIVEHHSEIITPAIERTQQRSDLPNVRFSPWLRGPMDNIFDNGRRFSDPKGKTRNDAAEPIGAGDWTLGNPRYVYLALGVNKDPQMEIFLSRQ